MELKDVSSPTGLAHPRHQESIQWNWKTLATTTWGYMVPSPESIQWNWKLTPSRQPVLIEGINVGNPFNGIESRELVCLPNNAVNRARIHSMELKVKCEDILTRLELCYLLNPFNGIERLLGPGTLYKLQPSNPFNGIESFSKASTKLDPTSFIESIQWNWKWGGVGWWFVGLKRTRNPFNGIER